MTVYELVKTLNEDSRSRLMSAGIISRSVEKHIAICELFINLTREGMPRMQAYSEISERCFTSEDNVRKIVQKFCREAD